jgi:hypothetical protein
VAKQSTVLVGLLCESRITSGEHRLARISGTPAVTTENDDQQCGVIVWIRFVITIFASLLGNQSAPVEDPVADTTLLTRSDQYVCNSSY